MNAKRTPYWHPAFPTPEGRTYVPTERKDIARLLCDARRERRVYRTRDTHNRLWYVLHAYPGSRHESGRIAIPNHA